MENSLSQNDCCRSGIQLHFVSNYWIFYSVKAICPEEYRIWTSFHRTNSKKMHMDTHKNSREEEKNGENQTRIFYVIPWITSYAFIVGHSFVFWLFFQLSRLVSSFLSHPLIHSVICSGATSSRSFIFDEFLLLHLQFLHSSSFLPCISFDCNEWTISYFFALLFENGAKLLVQLFTRLKWNTKRMDGSVRFWMDGLLNPHSNCTIADDKSNFFHTKCILVQKHSECNKHGKDGTFLVKFKYRVAFLVFLLTDLQAYLFDFISFHILFKKFKRLIKWKRRRFQQFNFQMLIVLLVHYLCHISKVIPRDTHLGSASFSRPFFWNPV